MVQHVLHLGPLAPLLAHDNVTGVTVNRIDDVWIDHGNPLEPTGLRLVEAAITRVTKRLLHLVPWRVDEQSRLLTRAYTRKRRRPASPGGRSRHYDPAIPARLQSSKLREESGEATPLNALTTFIPENERRLHPLSAHLPWP